MKNKLTTLKHILTVICLVLVSNLFGQLDIRTTFFPPYPSNLDYYTDDLSRILVNIRNNDALPLTYHLRITVNGPNGIHFESENPDFTYTIQGSGSTTLNGSQLKENFRNFDLSDIQNLTPEQQENILLYHVMPEGDYTLCIEAVSNNNVISNQDGNNCADFYISHTERPEIIKPENEEHVPANNSAVVKWTQDLSGVPINQRQNIRYKLAIVDYTLNSTMYAIDELFSGGVTGLTEFHTPNQIYNIQHGIDFNFAEGHIYALLVTSYDENNEVFFKDGGNSNVVLFQYGESDNDEATCLSPTSELYFPVSNDTIPFRYLSAIIKFDPYCDDYKKFQPHCTLKELPGMNNVMPEDDRDVRWVEKTPFTKLLEALGISLPISDEEEAYYKDRARYFTRGIKSEDPPELTRAKSYRYEMNGYMDMDNGHTIDFDHESTFVNGMPQPLGIAPSNHDTLPPGDIDFNWITGKKFHHDELLYITQVQGSTISDHSTYGPIDEKILIQVSKNETFDEIVFHDTIRLTMPANPSSDLTGIIYKDLDRTKNITEEGKYYWRLAWLLDPDSDIPENGIVENSMLYHFSPTYDFVIKAATPPNEEVPEEDPDIEPICNSPCIFEEVGPSGADKVLQINSTFTIAGLPFEVTEISGSNPYAGKGYVSLPLMNGVKVQVSFTNLKVNGQNKMYDGTITPIKEQEFSYSHYTTPFGTALGMNSSQITTMEGYFASGEKIINALTPGAKINLPIGIEQTIDNRPLTVGITDLLLEKDTARIRILGILPTPGLDEWITNPLSFGADICINAQGLSSDKKFFIAQDMVINQGGDNVFTIKGALDAPDELHSTFVQLDCHGFRKLNICGSYKADREVLVPEDEQGKPIPSGQVEFTFAATVGRGGQYIFKIETDRPFQLKDHEGWGFLPARNAWLDLSDDENPSGLKENKPAEYIHPAFGINGEENTWKGLYIDTIEFRFPESVRDVEDKRLKVQLSNTIIDLNPVKFTIDVKALDLLPWDEAGNINKWAASVDTIQMKIIQNSFTYFGFSGKIGTPISDEGEHLEYKCQYNHTNGENQVLFNVRPADTISAKIIASTIYLTPDSYLRVMLLEKDSIVLNISGFWTIDSKVLQDLDTYDFIMDSLIFQNFRITNNGFDGSEFNYTVSSPQKLMNGFPISIQSMSLSSDGITIVPMLKLTGDENSITAKTRLMIHAGLDKNLIPIKAKYEGITVEAILIDAQFSNFGLKGYIDFYKEASVKGVRGGLQVRIDLGEEIEIAMKADFGTYRNSNAKNFNTPDWYSYFFLDGIFYSSAGIPLSPGVTLFGVGGGIAYRMNMSAGLPTAMDILGSDPDPSQTDMNYTRNYNKGLSLKLTGLFGSPDEGQKYNFDVVLTATFSPSFGLTHIGAKGTFRVFNEEMSLASFGNAGESPVSGYASIQFNYPSGGDAVLDGEFVVYARVPYENPVFVGAGTVSNPPANWSSEYSVVRARFYVSSDLWYFHIGDPVARGGIKIMAGSSTLATLGSYLMIGHNLPTSIPPPSALFMEIFNTRNDDIQSSYGDVENILDGSSRASSYSASGFAFGASFDVDLGDEFSIFFYDLDASVGFDINLTHDANRVCFGTDVAPGIKGWYAGGQFYMGFRGGFGIDGGRLFGKVNIFQGSAAIIAQGGTPNPTWFSGKGRFTYDVLNGLFSGSCSFDATFGDVCYSSTATSPFGAVTIIQDVKPYNNDKDISVYTDMDVAFAFKIDNEYNIPVYNPNDPTAEPVIRRIKPYMKTFYLKDSIDKKIIPGKSYWSEENRMYKFKTDTTLGAERYYLVYVEARAKVNGSEDLKIPGTNEIYAERKLHKFKTGPRPDRIVPENLDFTYPYINQKAFLKGETTNDYGYIRLQRSGNEFLEGYSQMPGLSSPQFYVKFKTAGMPEIVENFSISENTKLIKFKVDQLLPSKTYEADFYRYDPPDLRPENIINGNGFADESGLSASVEEFKTVVEGDSVKSKDFKKIQIMTSGVSRTKLLFSLQFKTSRYNTMAEKMNDVTWDKNISGSLIATVSHKSELKEYIEPIDITSFRPVASNNGVGDRNFGPRIKLSIKVTNQQSGTYLPNAINTYILQRYNPQILNKIGYIGELSGTIKQRIKNSGTYGSNLNIQMPAFDEFEYTDFDESALFRSNTPTLSPKQVNPLAGNKFTSIDYKVNDIGVANKFVLNSNYSEFLYNNIFIKFPPPLPKMVIGTPYEFMTTSERNNVNATLNQNMFQVMKLNSGLHTFRMCYIYPHESGGNKYGSHIDFNYQHQ